MKAELRAIQERLARLEQQELPSEAHAQQAHRELVQLLGSEWNAAKLFGVLLLFIFMFVLFFL
jgi:hypothetical protein